MSNKKQTAVEWFASQIYEQIKGNDELFTNSLIQANAMHKEEIEQSLKFGINQGYFAPTFKSQKELIEQYYKETYEA